METYQNFKVEIEDGVAHVAFNRPEKRNALDMSAWVEMKSLFETLHKASEVRVIVLSGEGKHFCAGIDLSLLMGMNFADVKCEGRRREKLREFIITLQEPITAIEKCRKPVLAAVHNGCIGAGVDIVSACDMRYATKDAYFTVKEVDMGLVADLGTLQRLPKILHPGMVAEMAYTGRNVYGEEAKEIGLTNQVYEDKETMMEGVMEIARTIAEKSPLVVRGTKEILLYSRDHSVEDGLNYMVAWNAAMLLSDDLMESFQASMSKTKPTYAD